MPAPRLQRRGAPHRPVRPFHLLLRRMPALSGRDCRAARTGLALSAQQEAPMADTTGYETILVEQRGKVALITLNRPQALNALNARLVAELNDALDRIE